MKNIERFLERVPAPVWLILVAIIWFGAGYQAGYRAGSPPQVGSELTQWTQSLDG